MKSFRDIDFHLFVESLIKTIEMKDVYTAGHSRRVSEIAEMIGRKMGMNDQDCNCIHIAAHLHDIGKIGIPDGVLLKTGRLSRAEYVIMQQHAVTGASIFEKLEGFTWVAEIIRHHHERFDGRGYPDGLKGDSIPLWSSIIAVADSFDAMTTPRAYKSGFTLERAIEEIIINRGKQFHPEIADIFIAVCSDQYRIINDITGSSLIDASREYIPFGSIMSG